MNLDQLVAEAAALPPEERKKLISRLVALGRESREAEFRRTMAEKIDDHDPAHWVPKGDLAGHLRLDGDTE